MTLQGVINFDLIEPGQGNGVLIANQAFNMLARCAVLRILDRDISTAPTSPLEGDAYIIAGAPGGAWTTPTNKTAQSGDIAIFYNGWLFTKPTDGQVCYVVDEKQYMAFSLDGLVWFPIQESWQASEHWTGTYRNGKKVFARTVNVNNLPVGSLVTPVVKQVSHGLPASGAGSIDFAEIVTLQGFARWPAAKFGFPFPGFVLIGTSKFEAGLYVTGSFVEVVTNFDGNAFLGLVRMTYCKV
jgi:hypothetical protein